MEKLCLSKQELWDNYVFGQVNYQKFNDHVEELVNDIVQKNDLKLVTSLSGLYCGNNVSTYILLYYLLYIIRVLLYIPILCVYFNSYHSLFYII